MNSFSPAPEKIVWFIFGMMTFLLAGSMLGISKVLRHDRDWSFADAVSAADGKASSSRLIAFLGFIVMITVILGIGYSSLWIFLQTGQLPSLTGATTFLAACAALFAPYMANQIGMAIGGPVPPQQLAPVVKQTATEPKPPVV